MLTEFGRQRLNADLDGHSVADAGRDRIDGAGELDVFTGVPRRPKGGLARRRAYAAGGRAEDVVKIGLVEWDHEPLNRRLGLSVHRRPSSTGPLSIVLQIPLIFGPKVAVPDWA